MGTGDHDVHDASRSDPVKAEGFRLENDKGSVLHEAKSFDEALRIAKTVTGPVRVLRASDGVVLSERGPVRPWRGPPHIFFFSPGEHLLGEFDS